MSDTIKVMTYNIQSGLSNDQQENHQGQIKLIQPINPDLLGLEEVSVHANRNPEFDLPTEFRQGLKMHSFFVNACPNFPLVKGEYGVAALTKLPGELMGKFMLPIPQGEEPRAFIVVKIGARQPYYFVVTHFPFQGEFAHDEEQRTKCAQMITETLEQNHWFPAILVGDLNTYSSTSTIAWLRQKWDVGNDSAPDTPTAHCKNAGWRQIDFICTYPQGAFEFKKFTIVDNLIESDHRPVVAELVLK